jgi:hypothetical protein
MDFVNARWDFMEHLMMEVLLVVKAVLLDVKLAHQDLIVVNVLTHRLKLRIMNVCVKVDFMEMLLILELLVSRVSLGAHPVLIQAIA